jgi:hypothetical protein
MCPPAGPPNIVIVLMDDRVVLTILLRRWRIRESGQGISDRNTGAPRRDSTGIRA